MCIRDRAEIEHQGQRYFFCSKGCATKFRADPQKYVAETSEPEAPAGTKYTCPMHPEVVQVGPGSCPKCGMALVPMTPGAGPEEENAELRDHTRRFWLSAALSAPLVLLAMGPMVGPRLGSYPWVELALATPVVLWGSLLYTSDAA